MDNKKTPASTVVFYIIGIILIIVSLFMLWTAINYTKAYLQSYDASFKDMWSNSIQYVITQFVPYLGMGVICLGLGRAISGSARAKAAAPVEKPEEEEGLAADLKAAADAEDAADAVRKEAEIDAKIDALARNIDTNREVLSIKIEEKEKRDSYRIKELEKKVEGFLEDIKYINEPLEELVYKQAAGVEEESAEAEAVYAVEEEEPAVEVKAPGVVPQFFRVAKAMTMPACPAAAGAEAPAAEAKAPGAVPQFFRAAKTMTMPACPAANAAAETAAAAGAVPQVFRVARTMTMTV